MNSTMQEAVRRRIRGEVHAAYMSLSLSVALKEAGLCGMGHWLRMQYRAECGLALRLMTYGAGESFPLPELPPHSYDCCCPLACFRLAYRMARRLESSLRRLAAMARFYRDAAGLRLLLSCGAWRQGETASLRIIVLRLQTADNSLPALLEIDKELARRQFFEL